MSRDTIIVADGGSKHNNHKVHQYRRDIPIAPPYIHVSPHEVSPHCVNNYQRIICQLRRPSRSSVPIKANNRCCVSSVTSVDRRRMIASDARYRGACTVWRSMTLMHSMIRMMITTVVVVVIITTMMDLSWVYCTRTI